MFPSTLSILLTHCSISWPFSQRCLQHQSIHVGRALATFPTLPCIKSVAISDQCKNDDSNGQGRKQYAGNSKGAIMTP